MVVLGVESGGDDVAEEGVVLFEVGVGEGAERRATGLLVGVGVEEGGEGV